jgi:hypothetical protein
MMGSANGAGHSAMSGQQIQRRYDISYLQCMYSYGNQVPGQYYTRQPVGSAGVPPPPPRTGNAVSPPSTGSATPPPPPPPSGT